MFNHSQKFAILAASAVLANSSAVWANETGKYPMTRSPKGAEIAPLSWRSSISAQILAAPLTAGASPLIRLYDEPWTFGGSRNGGLQIDYQYRYGIARIGIGLRYRLLFKQGIDEPDAVRVQDVTLPFIVSVMETVSSGAEIGGTCNIGLGIAGVYSINWNDAGGTNLYLPPQWYYGPLLTVELALVGFIPIKNGFDFSLRAGLEGAAGAIFRISTPLSIGIRKRW